MLALALAVVSLAIVYALMIEPAWAARRALAQELPALRAQVAQMASLVDEAKRLRAAPQSADTPQATRAALESSIQAAGLQSGLRKFDLSGELFDLRFASVAHAVWLDWLDTTVRETRLRVLDVAVQREAEPGVVSAKLVLEFARRDAR